MSTVGKQDLPVWDLNILLATSGKYPAQPEIRSIVPDGDDEDSIYNPDGTFNRKYTDKLLRPFTDELSKLMEKGGALGKTEQDRVLELLTQSMILVNRIDLFCSLRYFVNYDESLEEFYKTANKNCLEQNFVLDRIKNQFLNLFPNPDSYSPIPQYDTDFWRGTVSDVEELGADYASYMAKQNILVGDFYVGLTEAEDYIEEANAYLRRRLWEARESRITSDESKDQFIEFLERAFKLEKARRSHRKPLPASDPTDERAGFSEEEEKDWIEAVGIYDDTGKDNFAALFHRFVSIKAGKSGEKMHACDIKAQVYNGAGRTKITLGEARESISSIFGTLGDDYAGFVDSYFDNSGLFDLELRNEKVPNPYTQQSFYTPSYISTWFSGHVYNVSDLAHELGHAVHYHVYSEVKKPPEEPPLIRDEFVATVFEIIATEKILDESKTKSRLERIEILNEVVRGACASIVTSASFHEMEKFIHDKDALPSKEELEKNWMGLTARTFGPDFDSKTYIQKLYDDPYFLDPLYSHIYSKTLCLVFGVIDQYHSNPKDFGDKMLKFMKEPGGRSLSQSVEGIFDIKAKDAWKVGTKWLGAKVDELDELITEQERINGQAKVIAGLDAPRARSV